MVAVLLTQISVSLMFISVMKTHYSTFQPTTNLVLDV
jgi:hypothetical protein